MIVTVIGTPGWNEEGRLTTALPFEAMDPGRMSVGIATVLGLGWFTHQYGALVTVRSKS